MCRTNAAKNTETKEKKKRVTDKVEHEEKRSSAASGHAKIKTFERFV